MPLLGKILKCGRSRIVIVTGRPVADLKPFLQPLDNLEIWGAHGLERLLPDGSYQQNQHRLRHTEVAVTGRGVGGRVEFGFVGGV